MTKDICATSDAGSDMSRPRNQFDVSSAVTGTEDRTGHTLPGADNGTSQTFSKPSSEIGEPNSDHGYAGRDSSSPSSASRGFFGNIPSPNGLSGYWSRMTLFRQPSLGYFSFDTDSLPNSPFLPIRETADKATQTPSPSSQAMTHVLQRVSETQAEATWRNHHHGRPFILPFPARWSGTGPLNTAGAMPIETLIGRDLRRIGDQYNNILLQRDLAGQHQVILPHPLPHIHQEPALVLCLSLLLLLVCRLIYLQGTTGNADSHR